MNSPEKLTSGSPEKLMENPPNLVKVQFAPQTVEITLSHASGTPPTGTSSEESDYLDNLRSTSSEV